MNEPRWNDVLDAFEERLAAQEAALADGVPEPVTPFVPPAHIPPLPSDLAERATQLAHRCRAIEENLARALRDAGVALDRAADAPASSGLAEPVYFDSRV